MGFEHVLESQQFDKETLLEIFNKADELKANPTNELKGKILATLFYEPSTRTRFSFEAAMMMLGGNVITTENAKEFSSAVKGESIEDSTRIVGTYANAIVMRHFEEGAAKRAAKVSKVPIINAGDGRGQHPTQALLDVYTIFKELGRINNFKIAMVGDLANGRTVRSLCYLLSKFLDIEMIFVSPENLRMKYDILDHLMEKGVKFRETDDLDRALEECDIVYMTRVQKERMSPEDYEKAKGKFVIDESNLNKVRSYARIMHPLPKVDEIDLPVEVEQNDKRIAYFRQAENGLYIRMALLSLLLKKN